MSKPFEVVSEYTPTGDQPQAIRELVEGVQAGLASQILLGVTGSGKTFTIANVVQELQRPTIVMAPNKTLAAQLYGEMREFFPRNAVEYFVSYYDYYQPEAYVPTTDTYIEKDASINEHIDQMRLSATKALLEHDDAETGRGQFLGENTAGRAGADDSEVDLLAGVESELIRHRRPPRDGARCAR